MSRRNHNVNLLKLADFERMLNDEYRRSHNPYGNRLTLEHDGDCRGCPHLKSLGNKTKGVRLSGGFGKCTRETGPCANPIPALGIGGVKSTYAKKEVSHENANGM